MNTLQSYFSKKKIDVVFNALGSNDKLVNLYLKEVSPLLNETGSHQTNYIKHACYSKYFNFDTRQKYTGFEYFKELDNEFRIRTLEFVSGLCGIQADQIENYDPNISGSYIEELKSSFQNFKDPLLYLSGGLDSEFVAKAMIDAGIKFTPVIFQWKNNDDKINNLHDITYAIDFCVDNKLSPIVRSINIERLWKNSEFQNLVKETQTNSPHINTYVYMVELMSEEFPDSTHVFGGEVRLLQLKNNKTANFAVMAKVPASSLGYNGFNYESSVSYSNTNAAFTGEIYLYYNYDGIATNNQSWSIQAGAGETLSTNGSTSGDWYIGETGGGIGFEYSTNGGSSWSDIAVGTNTIATLTRTTSATNAPDIGTYASFTLLVRNKSTPQTTITSSFNWRISKNYTYTVSDYATAGSYTFSMPSGGNYTLQITSAAGGGGGGGAFKDVNQGENGGFGSSAAGGGGGGETNQQTVTLDGSTYPSISVTVGDRGVGGGGGFDGTDGQASILNWTGASDIIVYGGFGGQGGTFNNPGSGRGAGNFNTTGYTGAAGSQPADDLAIGGGGGGVGSSASGSTGGGGLTYTLLNGLQYTLGAGGDGGTGGSPGSSGTNGTGNGGEGGSITILTSDSGSNSGGFGGSGRVIIVR